MQQYAPVILSEVWTNAYRHIALAYVDPGAGSMLLQLLLGGLAGLYVFARVFMRSVLRFFGFDKGDSKP